MKTILTAISAFSLLFPGTGAAQSRNTLTGFYPSADTVISYPSVDRRISVISRKQIGQYYCTFIGYEGESRPFIAAVTALPINDPNAEISRSVEFREILPTAGKVTTWGYIFDRNDDGLVDYVALLEGAGAIEPPKFPSTFPVRGKRMSPKEMEYFINHCGLVFSHWADDNFDGIFDGVVIPDLDPKRDWIRRRLVLRSTHRDGKIDEAWGFLRAIDGKREKVNIKSGKVSYRTLNNTVDTFSGRTLSEKSGILNLINEAARSCGFGRGTFPGR